MNEHTVLEAPRHVPPVHLRIEQTPSTLYVVRRESDGWYWREPTNTWTANQAKATRFAPKGEALLAMNDRTTLRYGSGWYVQPIEATEAQS